jgi:hypothetical protein
MFKFFVFSFFSLFSALGFCMDTRPPQNPQVCVLADSLPFDGSPFEWSKDTPPALVVKQVLGGNATFSIEERGPFSVVFTAIAVENVPQGEVRHARIVGCVVENVGEDADVFVTQPPFEATVFASTAHFQHYVYEWGGTAKYVVGTFDTVRYVTH